ncbi:hypothetical protein GRI62_05325 [Erythrobacter arachoides]|uniref:Uncharacterized protein n=1 Tax=Aurantiacibacter arachoides TaxID=1850444 RepID=A0A844ZYQ7_9SPHN|nr:hypothetical protein [Aurantiacibacter arachoides]MXO93025.1 hypothetical protein [Aurantiacibacter arachoides]GGD52581.1 hypothetical protein GCM10011411_10610 [Aurantiacibacter arachoides]
MRAALLAFVLLGGCSSGEALPQGQPVECALGGAAGFAPDCTMERAERGDARLLVVRHPDGSFRRFELGVPGRGLVTADGADAASVQRGDGTVEVQVGPDRYRLPVAG